MSSLSAHLRETEDHSKLPFHPACPVCRRDRLSGSLDGDELVSRRTQAAIAAGLIAFSTGGAPAALASPPDEISEGTAEVVEGGDPSTSADFELGGETDQLPDEVSAAPEPGAPVADSDEDAGPLEQEPLVDAREQVVQAEGVVTEPPAEPAPAPDPAPATQLPAAEPPEVVTTPPKTEPAQPEADAGPKAVGGRVREAQLVRGASAEAPSRTESSAVAPAPAPVPPPTPEAVPAVEPTAVSQPAPPAPEPVATQAAAATGGAAQGQRFHTVRPGESLWSIAADLLGDGATVPRIAREVNRLWELNDERIGTGRPDLLFAGTRLRLR